MPLIFKAWIDRKDLQAAPAARFVFGDNSLRIGMGGQARSFRGEPNAIGVATKWRPTMDENAFLSDDDKAAWVLVEEDIQLVEAAHRGGLDIYVPRDGLGTGLSQLPTRAPRIHSHLVQRFRAMHLADFPW